MLLLRFRMEDDDYVIDVQHIVEVLPFVKLKHVVHAPDYVAGLLNYRGQPVPILDLCRIALGRASKPRLNTRIVLARYDDAAGQTHLLGYIIERVLDTVKREASAFLPSLVKVANSPYLGDIALHSDGMMQLIRLDALLPDEAREFLF